jgi:hypothetical protein
MNFDSAATRLGIAAQAQKNPAGARDSKNNDRFVG